MQSKCVRGWSTNFFMPFQVSSVLRLRLRWISHILTGPPPWIYDLSSNQPLVSNPMCICEVVKKFSSISGNVN
ncbi:unnamed protein product [Prunus armeniaca]